MRAMGAVVGVGLVLSGCSVPLGGTSYPAATMAGIEGLWEPASQASEGGGGASTAGERHDVLRYTITIQPIEATWTSAQANGREKVWAPLAIGSGQRYLVTVRIEGTPVPPESGFFGLVSSDGAKGADEALVLDLEGEFIRTREHVLFTFQRRMIDVTGLSVPLQRTAKVTWVRAQEAGAERLQVQFPAQELAFVPVAMAGEFRFVPPASDGESVSLVAEMDDVFRTLDGLGDDGWRPAAVLVRRR